MAGSGDRNPAAYHAGHLRDRLRALIRELHDDYERYTHMDTLEHHISQAEGALNIMREREAVRMAKVNARRAIKGLPPILRKRELVDPGDPAETEALVEDVLSRAPKGKSGELRDKNGNLIRTEGWAMELDQLELPRDENGRMLVDPTDDHAAAMKEAGATMVAVPERLQQRMNKRDRLEVDAGEAVDHIAEKCRPYKEEQA